MAQDIRKLVPIELSQLPEIERPAGFSVFVSRTEEDGTFTSGRYSFDDLEKYARDLQLERRISLTIESDVFQMFIGEEMDIYKIVVRNVEALTINGEEIDRFDHDGLDINIEKSSLMEIGVKRQLTDSRAYLFIYAKAKN